MLRFIAKIFHSILHILAFFKAALTIFFVIALWIISTRPIILDFATPHLEEGLNNLSPDYEVTIAETQFTLASRHGLFRFQAREVSFSGADGSQILTIPDVSLNLSLPDLLHGDIIIENIALHGSELRIYRQDDGIFSFGLARHAEEEATLSPLLLDDLGRLFLQFGQDNDRFQSFSLLESNLIFIDEVTDTQLNITPLDFIVEKRDPDILYTEDALNLSLAMQNLAETSQSPYLSVRLHFDLPMGEDMVSLNAHGFYSPEAELIPLNVDFSPFMPPLIAEEFPEFAFLSALNAPLNAQADIELSPDLSLQRLQTRVFLGEGSLNLPAYFETPPHFDHWQMQLDYDSQAAEFSLHDMLLDIGGARLSSTAQIGWQENVISILLEGHLTNMEMGNLAPYWPNNLNINSRNWVFENIPSGIADNATMHLEASYNLATETNPASYIRHQLYGEIDYSDLDIRWIGDDIPAFTDVMGTAQYDAENFNLDIERAQIEDIMVSNGNINISGMGTDDMQMDVTLPLNGQMDSLIHILSLPPLDLFKDIDLPISRIRGVFEGETHISFPLLGGRNMQNIEVIAAAEMQDIMIIDVSDNAEIGFKGHKIDNGLLALNISTHGENAGMSINGSLHINDTPAQISWRENFNPDAETSIRKVEVSLPLDHEDRARLGLNIETWLQGVMPLTLTYEKLDDELTILRGMADLSQTQIALPRLGYAAEAGEGAVADFRLAIDNSEMIRIPEFSLITDELRLQGATNLYRDDAGRLQLDYIEFSELVTPESNISIELHAVENTENSSNIGYNLHISGAQLNLAGLDIHANDEERESEDELRGINITEIGSLPMPLHIEADIDKVIFGENSAWHDIILNGNYDGTWWNYIDFYATSEERPMRLQFIPATDIRPSSSPTISQRLLEIPDDELSEHHQFYAEFADISPLFAMLGRPTPMEGGQIVVTGITNHAGSPLDLTGHIEMGPQRISHAPVMARLLHAISLIGLAESLTSRGISFSRLTAEYRWHDNSLMIADGRISGPSLGLTFSGSYVPETKEIDFNGTVIPINSVNQILGAIPLFGTILADSDGDLFAATYHIEGKMGEPEISVNPLAILTPGFVRRLFFVDDSPELHPAP